MSYDESMKIIVPIKQSCQRKRAPLYRGKLSCGLFGIAEDFVEKELSLDEKFFISKESVFFVRSEGDSMLPEIKPQDILIVDRSRMPLSGDIIAFFLNGDPLCKQYVIQGDRIILHSLSVHYKDILVKEEDDFQVFGTVMGLARDFKE